MERAYNPPTRRDYPDPEQIAAFRYYMEEERAFQESLDADPRGTLDYEAVEGGVCDDLQEAA